MEPVLEGNYPRPARDLLEAQIALARLRISAGSIDGVDGPQTRAALRAFQLGHNLPETGDFDAATREKLLLESSSWATNTVTSSDLSRLQPLSTSWLGKSQQSALAYETVLEMMAEKSQANPKLIRKLNPTVTWERIAEGTAIRVPNIQLPEPPPKAAFAWIQLEGRLLQVFDSQTNLLAHFPCSIAQRVEKRPVGMLSVQLLIPDPDYTFDPAMFPESEEAKTISRKLILPPGPNNPVGSAWLGLNKPGYGIHGTPLPEQVGRTESHGCFRLANWNAECLLRMAWVGMPVYVAP